MKTKKYLATITILVENRQKNVPAVNRVLTDNGRLIMARLGISVQRACVGKCAGLIVIAIEASKKEILELTKKLNKLSGILTKSCII